MEISSSEKGRYRPYVQVTFESFYERWVFGAHAPGGSVERLRHTNYVLRGPRAYSANDADYPQTVEMQARVVTSAAGHLLGAVNSANAKHAQAALDILHATSEFLGRTAAAQSQLI